MRNEFFTMTSYRLKIIAVIAMTIDHAAKIIGQSGMMAIFPNMPLSTAYLIVNLMEAIGRMAFPLFAFMIAEGTFKTRSMPKYIGRLALFALISEPFFYYAFNMRNASIGGFFDSLSRLNLTNVFFTLTLGAIAIYAYQLLERGKSKKRLFLFVPIFLILIFIVGYAKSDYGIAGIILIVALFFAKKKTQKIIVVFVWSLGLYIFGQAFNGFGFNWSQVTGFAVVNSICAVLSCVLIWRYNGKRGRPLKWSFYIYYPAHLLLLAFLGVALS